MNTSDSASENPGAAAPAGDDPVEMIRKVYARDLREKDTVHTVFKVTRKAKQTARSGKPFLALTLGDRTGEVDARVFDRADVLDPTFVQDDFVLVKGSVITFHGKPQLVIERLERLDPEPIDQAEFAIPPRPAPEPEKEKEEKKPAAPASASSNGAPSEPRAPSAEQGERGGNAVGQIREIVERTHDPHVKALLLAFLDDPEIGPGLRNAPAAKGIHHAYKGGLAEHILSVMRLAHRMADHYPMVDRDLLVAGAMLHDIGKVKELAYDKGNFDYTDEGRLVGHLVMTAQEIHLKATKIPGFPPLLEHHLTHGVLAHHGQLEYGSPKLPVTLEAYIVHMIDSLDSRIASWLDAMAKDPNDRWTDVIRLYDRHLWKGPAPTARGRSPVDGRRGKREEKRKGKGGGQGQQGQGGNAGNTPAAERPPRRDAPSSAPAETGPKLSFKPLAELAPPSAAEPAEATPPTDGTPPTT